MNVTDDVATNPLPYMVNVLGVEPSSSEAGESNTITGIGFPEDLPGRRNQPTGVKQEGLVGSVQMPLDATV